MNRLDVLGIANLLLGLVGLLWLMVRTQVRRDEMPREVQWLMYVTQAFIVALLVVSVGQIAEEQPRGDWVPAEVGVIFLVEVILLWYLWETRNTLYRTGTRSPNGNDPGTPGTDDDEDYPDREVQA